MRVSNLFGETMILLHQTNNAIWGVASPGEEITVTVRWGAESNPVSNQRGDRKVLLATPKHGTGFSLAIRCDNEIRIANVAQE